MTGAAGFAESVTLDVSTTVVLVVELDDVTDADVKTELLEVAGELVKRVVGGATAGPRWEGAEESRLSAKMSAVRVVVVVEVVVVLVVVVVGTVVVTRLKCSSYNTPVQMLPYGGGGLAGSIVGCS